MPSQFIAGAGDVFHDLQWRMVGGLLQADHVDLTGGSPGWYAGFLFTNHS